MRTDVDSAGSPPPCPSMSSARTATAKPRPKLRGKWGQTRTAMCEKRYVPPFCQRERTIRLRTDSLPAENCTVPLMAEISSSFILGVLSGIIASLAVWWLLTHCWTPSIKFSAELAEYELPDGNVFFQCAFENDGKRTIVDLEVHVRIGIKGYKGATAWAYHSVRSNASRIPLLAKGKLRRVRLFDSREKIEFVDKPSKSLRNNIERCWSLREILDLGEDGQVSIHVFGYDSLSGTRKHFQSKPYRTTDIRKGTFRGLNVVQNTRFLSNSVCLIEEEPNDDRGSNS